MATPTALPSSFTAGDILTAANMNLLRGAFRILQVVSTTKTDTFTMTSTSFTDVTGLSVNVTPRETASKILIIATVQVGGAVSGSDPFLRLMRGSTAICIGDAAGSRIQSTSGNGPQRTVGMATNAFHFLDSPSTTSSTTYKVQMMTNVAATYFVNRAEDDTDNAFRHRAASTITVLEVSA